MSVERQALTRASCGAGAAMLASPLIDHQPCHKHGQPDVRRDHDERRSMTPPRHGSRGQEQQHGYRRRHPLEAWCQEQVEEKRAGHYRSCQYHLRARCSDATQREQDTHDHGRPPKDHGDKWHNVDHAFDITVVRGGLDSSFEFRNGPFGALDIRVFVLSSANVANEPRDSAT